MCEHTHSTQYDYIHVHTHTHMSTYTSIHLIRVYIYTHIQETLTGFKWMGNRSHDHLEEGCEVLFAYEEAIGFMFGTTVLDKDGISAAAVLAEYGGWLYSQGKTFGDQLEFLYQR